MSEFLSRHAIILSLIISLLIVHMPPGMAESAVRPVKLLKLSESSDDEKRMFPAVIDAGDSSELNFSVGGRLVELKVTEAQDVKQGELIARLDAKDYESNKASAQAEFDNAEQEYQRAVRLAEQDAISKKELEQRKSRRDVAQAQLDTAEKALADTVIYAPFDGAVSTVPVKELQNVGPGELICTLLNTSEYKATINLPAAIITQVPKREKKGAFVILDAAPDVQIPAEFKEASLEADPTSQTYEVTFVFQPPEDLMLLPGMNANMLLVSAERSDAPAASGVTVPLAAIMTEGEQQFVWVVDEAAMTVSKREVQVKDGIGEKMTILEGLTAGETIVGAGASYLSEGMKVRPWEN
ncbi:MAG: efflux RND transporter periplasmic adaptor subunit [Verrucomicrobiota bacterium]